MKITLYPKYLIRSLFVHDRHNFFKAGYKLLYPEYSRHGMTPWQHYVIDGKRKGFDKGNHPSDFVFFREGYELEYPDVKASGYEPWHHYAEKGKAEGRDNGMHPDAQLFFMEGYLLNYPDVKNAGMDPWKHYVTHGRAEGRNNGTQGLNFCEEAYLLNYPAVKWAGEDPWKHYVLHIKDREATDCLNDYAMRIAGHEQEFARALYLAPQRFSRMKNSSAKKVLLIGHEFSVSGAPLALLNLAKILISDGYIVDIAVRDICRSVPVQLYDGLGADVFLIPESTECFPSADRMVSSYDLVIVNTIVMAAYAELCKKLNVPHIWYVHENVSLLQKYFGIVNGCKQRFFDDHQNVLCVSKYVSDCLYSEYEIRCRYLNNFVTDISEANDFGNKKENKTLNNGVRIFAVVGNLLSNKDQESAIAAFLYLAANPLYKGRWKLLMIGKYGKDALDPALGTRLESVTRNVPDIEWCGQVTESKWELFSSVDFFIVPSLEESSSLVTIEAAMLGKPVIITTRVGAKYLAENNAGFLFEPGNKAALRDLLEKCIDMSDSEYLSMSRQIRKNYEKTSTLSVYRRDLSAIISDVFDRAGSEAKLGSGSMHQGISPRALCSGANVISSGNVEYIRFADFSHLQKPSGNGVSASACHGSAVGVVVPVYNGIEHLKVLIPSLFKNTDIPHKFIFVDDCSQEETADFLRETVNGRDDCILLRNEQNLGFVKSVNRGAEKALESCGSFVMLNSDTEVPSGWLGRLMRPIFEDGTISSVTPLSNRCTVFSFPFLNSEKNDKFLNEFGVEEINRAIQNSPVDKHIDIPTGHGFCMAISGKVWKKIGGLNAELFGRGYGEENEWSLRAELDGYRNVLIPGLYVAHHEKGSFTSKEREANCASALDIINVMFPSYNSRVQNYIRERPASSSLFSIYLTLAAQRGYRAEIFTDPSLFKKRMDGSDGIFAIKYQAVAKIAVKLLGDIVLVANVRDSEKTGIFEQ